MSTSKVLTRLAAAAGVVLATLALAAPAYAADTIDTSMSSVPSSLTAGARADGFTVTVKNTSDVGVVGVKITFVIKLAGLTHDQVRMFRTLPTQELIRSESGGNVIVTDNAQLDFTANSKSRIMTYTIQFLSGAPSGKATLTAQSVRGTTVLGSDNASITVKGGVAGPTTTSGPPKTSEPPVTGDPASMIPGGSQGQFATIADKSVPLGGSGGIPTGLYVMGALLVGVGGAILWMLFRQRPAPVEEGYATDEYSPVPSLGYPAGRASATTVLPPPGGPRPAGPPNMHPTTPLPTVRSVPTVENPLLARNHPPPMPNQPPPVDPWGDGPHR